MPGKEVLLGDLAVLPVKDLFFTETAFDARSS